METPTVTLDDVRSAAVRIEPYIHRTPLFDSATLSRLTGTRLGLKAENLQRTGGAQRCSKPFQRTARARRGDPFRRESRPGVGICSQDCRSPLRGFHAG